MSGNRWVRSKASASAVWRMLWLATILLGILALLSCSVDETQDPSPDIELYRQKVQEIIDEFGAPSSEVQEMRSFVAGVACAQLVDFGAGDDLLVCYRDPNAAQESTYSDSFGYRLEVWASDGAGSIECIFDCDPNLFMSLAWVDGQRCIHLSHSEGDFDDVEIYSYYGLAADKTFQLVKELKCYQQAPAVWLNDGQTVTRREIDGVEVSEGEFIAAMRDTLTDEEQFNFVSYVPASTELESTIERAREGIESLGISLSGESIGDSVTSSIGSDEVSDESATEVPYFETGSSYTGWLQTGLTKQKEKIADSASPRGIATRPSDDTWLISGSAWCSASRDGLYMEDSRRECELVSSQFYVNDDTEFLTSGGLRGPRAISRARFESYLDSVSEVGLELEIVDGTIVTAILRS